MQNHHKRKNTKMIILLTSPNFPFLCCQRNNFISIILFARKEKKLQKKDMIAYYMHSVNTRIPDFPLRRFSTLGNL